MFPGKSNHHLLSLIMKAKGRINKKVLKRGNFSEKYFNPNTLLFYCPDENTQNVNEVLGDHKKEIGVSIMPTETILWRLEQTFGIDKIDKSEVNNFADFLEKTTNVDPLKRLTAKEALLHPFLQR